MRLILILALVVCVGLFAEFGWRPWRWRSTWTFGEKPPDGVSLGPRRSPKRPPLIRPPPPAEGHRWRARALEFADAVRTWRVRPRLKRVPWLRLWMLRIGLSYFHRPTAFLYRLGARRCLLLAGALILSLGVAAPVALAMAFDSAPSNGLRVFEGVGNSTVDDTAAWNAQINALAAGATGGGVFFVPPCPGGLGYRIVPATGSGNYGAGLPANVLVIGSGYAGRIIATSADLTPLLGTPNIFFQNVHLTGGDSNITIFGLWIVGPGRLDPNALTTMQTKCIALQSSTDNVLGPSGYLDQCSILACHIVDWPGPQIHMINVTNYHADGNTSLRGMRGGIIVWNASTNGTVNGNVITTCYDDCIAINSRSTGSLADAGTVRPQWVTISGNTCSKPDYVAEASNINMCINVRGAQHVDITGNECVGADDGAVQGGSISIRNEDVLDANYILVDDNEISASGRAGIVYFPGFGPTPTGSGQTIKLTNNVISTTAGSGIAVRPQSTVTVYDVTITGNEISFAGLSTDTARSGIDVVPSVAGSTIVNLNLSRNTISNAVSRGLTVGSLATVQGFTMHDVTVTNPNTAAGANIDGIQLAGVFDTYSIEQVTVINTSASTVRYAFNASGTFTTALHPIRQIYAVPSQFGTAVLNGGASLFGVNSKTSAYTIVPGDSLVLADATGGAFNVTLPSAAGVTGQAFTVKRTSAANNVTVATTGGQTIDGAATYVLAAIQQTVTVISDGTNWRVA